MFNKYHALTLASLLGLGVLAVPASTASAAALPNVQQSLPGENVTNENMLQQVHRRHRHDHYGHFGLFFSPFAFGGGYYYDPYFYGPPRLYRGGSSAHVRWCLNRYRSYNPWSNTWRAYSGRVYRCRSPFRYY